MAEPLSVTPSRIEFPDVSIDLLQGAESPVPGHIWMKKSHWYVESYREIRKQLHATTRGLMNILEIGMLRGGSAVFLREFFDPTRLAAIDVRDQIDPAARDYLNAHGVTWRSDIDQGDRAAVTSFANRTFPDGLDLVIDDASHLYAPSKTTFETLFPRLRPGGVYILEDWAWSLTRPAQEASHYWASQASLVNLVFEMTLLFGAYDTLGNALISDLRFGNGLIWLVRGPGQVPLDEFSIDEHRPLRGREMVLI